MLSKITIKWSVRINKALAALAAAAAPFSSFVCLAKNEKMIRCLFIILICLCSSCKKEEYNDYRLSPNFKPREGLRWSDFADVEKMGQYSSMTLAYVCYDDARTTVSSTLHYDGEKKLEFSVTGYLLRYIVERKVVWESEIFKKVAAEKEIVANIKAKAEEQKISARVKQHEKIHLNKTHYIVNSDDRNNFYFIANDEVSLEGGYYDKVEAYHILNEKISKIEIKEILIPKKGRIIIFTAENYYIRYTEGSNYESFKRYKPI